MSAESATPPVIVKKPYQVIAPHGATRVDDYYWLRDDSRQDPEMLAVLDAENAYADAILASSKPIAETLYQEITGRIKQDDSSVPYFKHGYWYYSRFEAGKDYAIIARRKTNMDSLEEILFEQNIMAAGKGYFSIGDWQVSPNNQLIAWAEDSVGRRQYQLFVKDLATGKTFSDVVENIEANIVWADDNQTLFYIEKDPITLLSKRVKSHVLGDANHLDNLVYEEADDSFYMGISRTRSEQYICITVESTVSSEQHFALANNPTKFTLIAKRERDIEYSADHLNNRWVIRTNWNAPNYKLMTLGDCETMGSRSDWRDFIEHKSDVFIEGFELFNLFIAIEERSNALLRIRTLSNDGKQAFVASDEAAYTMDLNINASPDSQWLRYAYTSMTTPNTIFEVDTQSGERKLLKQDPVLGGYNPDDYVTERQWATARDDTKIPISIVYKKGFKKDGSAALLQYSYGSYGLSTDPRFSIINISLLDRGMVYAIAHIRGGQEMGRAWYDNGKLFNKINTFTDFIDVTRFLVKQGYANQDRVAAYGGSAGGLLMGAISNMAPQDYKLIISQVPFLDVVTTMLDESIPLTTNEFDQWGNPAQKDYYDYMLSYSPYDQIKHQAYPTVFVGTGLWDSQVQYFEPAKYVAKLRDYKTNDNPVVFRVNMEAGHGGKSGRFQRYKENSEQFAYMLEVLGVR